MKCYVLSAALAILAALPVAAQEGKLPADTLAVQAEGQFEADPDLAILTFRVTAQEKDLRRSYERAVSSIQRILQLAERNALAKQDVSAGPLTVFPLYNWGDRKQRARAYRVEGRVTLHIRDFQRVSNLVDESVEDGIVDFRSLVYSLDDDEAAKQKAISEAMRRAEYRARAALAGNGRRLGALRSASVDVKQLTAEIRHEPALPGPHDLMESRLKRSDATAPPLPEVSPEKIVVRATVQCIYQLQ